MSTDSFVQEILKDMPPDIKAQEAGHLIMLGYTGEGQSHFIVTAVNSAEIHIRIKGRLFGRLRRTCADIHSNVKAYNRRHHGRRPTNDGHSGPELTLHLRKTIEVMEPRRDHPTIRGDIIESAGAEVFRQSPYERALLAFTFIVSTARFWLTPKIPPQLQDLSSALGGTFSAEYIQGAMGRTYSAFLVTFFVTVLNLSIRIFELRRLKLTRWDSGIERTASKRSTRAFSVYGGAPGVKAPRAALQGKRAFGRQAGAG